MLDIKGMTRFAEVSQRADGRLRGKRKHPGFCALHIAIDDHSRYALRVMLADHEGRRIPSASSNKPVPSSPNATSMCALC